MATRTVLAALLVCGFAGTALAGVTQKTLYNFFPVSGSDAVSIYRSVTARSEVKGGIETLATTGIQMKTNLLTTKGTKCTVAKADVVMNFKVNVPRLTNESRLSAGLRSDWRAFAAHLKMHEEKHRAIWMTCAARYSASLRPLLDHDCGDLNRAINGLWSAAQKTCRAPNNAWDAKDQKALLRLPFIKRVANGG